MTVFYTATRLGKVFKQKEMIGRGHINIVNIKLIMVIIITQNDNITKRESEILANAI